jgi:Ras GTPase-activating-like protein IQGAP2/3
MYINIAVQYIRPKQVFYIQETLQKIILDIVGSDDLDLEVDPTIVSFSQLINEGWNDTFMTQIHRARVSLEEMRSGVKQPNKDVAFHQALKDPDTRAEYIRRKSLLPHKCRHPSTFNEDLQILQWWTETFVTAITQSTPKIPYGMRFLARETLTALRVCCMILVSLVLI